MTTLYTTLDSPLGDLLITGDGSAITGVFMTDHRHGRPLDPTWKKARTPFTEAIRQLSAYFAGERMAFDLPLNMQGSAFQQAVWQRLLAIPYGETRSYGQIAAEIKKPTASRAVGLANGKNPISIIVPCHRVIGASGSLVGYGGGLERKRWLLDHEARHARGLWPELGAARAQAALEAARVVK